MKMKVTRPFILAGIRQEIDTEFEIADRSLAAMLKHEGKAVSLDPVAASGTMTTASSGLVAGSKADTVTMKNKGKQNE